MMCLEKEESLILELLLHRTLYTSWDKRQFHIICILVIKTAWCPYIEKFHFAPKKADHFHF